jgi:hypothetical protein
MNIFEIIFSVVVIVLLYEISYNIKAILFEWKDAADLARKTLTQIKAQEE